MRRILLSLISLFGGWISPVFGQATLLSPPPTPCEPVNPNATAEARALLKTICAVSGKFILSGQHNFPFRLSQHSEKTAANVGKYPMIWGSDFGFTGGTDKDSIEGRDVMIEEAKEQYAAGSIITLMWHAIRPLEDEPVQPGAGWKGPQGFQALYRMTFDRMVNFHRLDNLVWVWNANAPNGKNAGPYYDYYPGAQYTDVLAADVYGEFRQSHHDDLAELAAGKPIALGEIGQPPSIEALRNQPKWAWFMGWSEIFDREVTDAHKALFDDPRTLSRGDKLPEALP